MLMPCGVMEIPRLLLGAMQHVAGDSSAVQDKLRGVQQMQATAFAFAAILEDGSVVTWGHAKLWR